MIKNDELLLETTVINPNSTPVASVIWLHGLGADNQDFIPIVSELRLPSKLPVRFVFPNAPMRAVTINNGYTMRAWYDILSLKIDERADEQGITASVKAINQLIDHEIASGIPAEKIILAGFSQGAVIALTTGLTSERRLGGILALSGYLPYAENTLGKIASANKSIPIFLGHGKNDTVVPYFIGQASYAILEKHQMNVSWHSYAMPHSICEDEILDIREWLLKII